MTARQNAPARPGWLSVAQLPNLISALRILLVVPTVASLLRGDYALAIALVAVAGFSDGLDGFLAKHFGWQSRLGGVLDPLADKLLFVSVFLALAWTGLAPLWLAGVVLGRDLVIVSGALAYNLLIGPLQPEPSIVSKVNTATQLLFVLLTLLKQIAAWIPGGIIMTLGAGVLVTCCVSGLDYVMRWSRKAMLDRA